MNYNKMKKRLKAGKKLTMTFMVLLASSTTRSESTEYSLTFPYELSINTTEVENNTPSKLTPFDFSESDLCERDTILGEYRHFAYKIAQRESANTWHIRTNPGFIGKYQFAEKTLQGLDYDISFERFARDPNCFNEAQQDEAFVKFTKLNERILSSEISLFSGELINNMPISRFGILGAAHLAGPGNVKKFIRTNGEHDPKDKFGTRLSDYLTHFNTI